MEELDKLYQLFENDQVDLLVQLTIGLDIDLVQLWLEIYYKYKDHLEDLEFVFNDKHVALYYYPNSDKWDATLSFNKSDRHDTLKGAIEELIEGLYE